MKLVNFSSNAGPIRSNRKTLPLLLRRSPIGDVAVVYLIDAVRRTNFGLRPLPSAYAGVGYRQLGLLIILPNQSEECATKSNDQKQHAARHGETEAVE